MFAVHMCSGRPVVADCWRANSSGDCCAVAQRQRGVQIQLAGLLHPLDQFVAGNFAQRVAGLAGLAHVALQQAAVGLADLGDRLAGDEVHDLVDFQRLVRLAPAQNRNVEHGDRLSSSGCSGRCRARAAGNSQSAFNTRRRSSLRPVRGTAARRSRRPRDICT